MNVTDYEKRKSEAKSKITDLVAKYESLNQTQKNKLDEAKTKQGFIMPLFRSLGWDFDDIDEVTPEESASSGRVDYAFKLHSVSQFYLEAKPIRASLANPDFVKQIITYAYNKGVTWAILTNFDELRVFNAQGKAPFITLNFKDYLSSFDKIWLLSRQSLESGLLNKEAMQSGALPFAVAPIENRLFQQLRQWREVLINQLRAYNHTLKLSQIDEVIQKLFDRLIFIRSCEDKGIEEKKLLSTINRPNAIGKTSELIVSLHEIFGDYDDYYDSELFAKHLIDDVFIESETIRNIIVGLYEIPGGMASYDFSLIDADVLGAVYEQYLGHVARKTKERDQTQLRLKTLRDDNYEVIDKKTRRKEQGIYYTPKYITNYIVKATVGNFLKEHNATEIENIKILDPACGSGSFLIRAYDELLTHRAQSNASNNIISEADRTEILIRSIFGVDLDPQAIEIARLNLLLRSLAKRERLPILSNNIKCGNSIISGSTAELSKYFGDNYKSKAPFNWNEEFDKVMSNGGFDIVIGNPPYGADFDNSDRSYINDHYPYSKSNKNSAMVFIERAISLTKDGGYFSFIVPKSLAYSQKWASGRRLLLDKLGYVSDTSRAFKEVLLEQMVVVVAKKFSHQQYYKSSNLSQNEQMTEVTIAKQITESSDTILLDVNSDELAIYKKVTVSKLSMKDISKTARGLPFQKYLIKKGNGELIYRGDHIGRYVLHKSKETIPESVIESNADKISFLRQPKIMSQQIVAHVQKPIDHVVLMSTLDKEGVLTLDTVQNTIINDKRYNYSFILGLLNSLLWSWYAYRFIYSKAIRTMHFDGYYIGKFPLPTIDFDNEKHLCVIHEIEDFVDRVIELNERLAPILDIFSYDRDNLVQEIKHLNNKIDHHVYELYKLNETEIQIIEGTSKGY